MRARQGSGAYHGTGLGPSCTTEDWLLQDRTQCLPRKMHPSHPGHGCSHPPSLLVTLQCPSPCDTISCHLTTLRSSQRDTDMFPPILCTCIHSAVFIRIQTKPMKTNMSHSHYLGPNYWS